MYEIRLPIPPMSISPNAKRKAHWSAYSGDARDAKDLAFLTAYNAFPDARDALTGVKVIYDLIIRYPAKAQLHDEDNAVGWMKHYLDGLAAYFAKGNDRTWQRGGCSIGHIRPGDDPVVVIRLREEPWV